MLSVQGCRGIWCPGPVIAVLGVSICFLSLTEQYLACLALLCEQPSGEQVRPPARDSG